MAPSRAQKVADDGSVFLRTLSDGALSRMVRRAVSGGRGYEREGCAEDGGGRAYVALDERGVGDAGPPREAQLAWLEEDEHWTDAEEVAPPPPASAVAIIGAEHRTDFPKSLSDLIAVQVADPVPAQGGVPLPPGQPPPPPAEQALGGGANGALSPRRANFDPAAPRWSELGPVQWRMMAVCCLASVSSASETFASAFVALSASESDRLVMSARAPSAAVLSRSLWIVAGEIAGALAGGLAADLWLGRHGVASYAAWAVGALGFLSAAMPREPTALLAARMLVALGTGAFGVFAVLLCETLPVAERGARMCVVLIAHGLSALESAAVSPAIVESLGWRGALIAAALPGMLLAISMGLLPESIHWLAARGDEGGVRSLVRMAAHEQRAFARRRQRARAASERERAAGVGGAPSGVAGGVGADGGACTGVGASGGLGGSGDGGGGGDGVGGIAQGGAGGGGAGGCGDWAALEAGVGSRGSSPQRPQPPPHALATPVAASPQRRAEGGGACGAGVGGMGGSAPADVPFASAPEPVQQLLAHFEALGASTSSISPVSLALLRGPKLAEKGAAAHGMRRTLTSPLASCERERSAVGGRPACSAPRLEGCTQAGSASAGLLFTSDASQQQQQQQLGRAHAQPPSCGQRGWAQGRAEGRAGGRAEGRLEHGSLECTQGGRGACCGSAGDGTTGGHTSAPPAFARAGDGAGAAAGRGSSGEGGGGLGRCGSGAGTGGGEGGRTGARGEGESRRDEGANGFRASRGASPRARATSGVDEALGRAQRGEGENLSWGEAEATLRRESSASFAAARRVAAGAARAGGGAASRALLPRPLVALPLLALWSGVVGAGTYGVLCAVPRAPDRDRAALAAGIFGYSIFSVAAGLFLDVLGSVAAMHLVERAGRRASQGALFALACAALGGAGLSARSAQLEPLCSSLYALGRIAHGAGVAAAWVALPELLPTERRATGCALAQVAARLGVLAAIECVRRAPPRLTSIGTPTVQLLAAAASAAGCLLALALPETAGVRLERAGVAAEEALALARARARLLLLARRCRW